MLTPARIQCVGSMAVVVVGATGLGRTFRAGAGRLVRIHTLGGSWFIAETRRSRRASLPRVPLTSEHAF
jgi:hypothetical protein